MGYISSTYQSHGPFLSWSKLLLLTTQATLTGFKQRGIYYQRPTPERWRGAKETDS